MKPRTAPGMAGFTLIELMVTLAVLAVLLGVGVPSFRSYIADQRTRTATDEFFGALLYARSEAVKRNENVRVSLARDSANQLTGWAITSDTSKTYADCISNNADCLKIHSAQGIITVADGATSLIYQSSGRLSSGTIPSSPFTICVSGGKQRELQLNPSGQPFIKKSGTTCP